MGNEKEKRVRATAFQCLGLLACLSLELLLVFARHDV